MLNAILAIVLGLGVDVVTVTTGTAGNAGSAAAEMVTYLSAKALDVAVTNTVLDQFGDKEPFPAGSGKTIRFNRFEKFSTVASPTQLTEGTAPDSVGATINQFEATMEAYGFVVRLSDLAVLTAKHPLVQQTLKNLGLHAAETRDQLIFNVLDAATGNYRPSGRASDATIVATDVITYADLVNLLSSIQGLGAMPFDGGSYVYVAPPAVASALLKDADYKAANQYKNPEKIYKGQIGSLANFDVVVSNAPSFAATTQTTSGKANKVYSSFALGRGAYQISDLQSLQVFVTPPGGQSDPLHQNTKIGYKMSFKAVISNQDWIKRVRTAGLDSVNNA